MTTNTQPPNERMTPERRWWLENMCRSKEMTEVLSHLDAVTREREKLEAAFNAACDAMCPVVLDAVALVLEPAQWLVEAIRTVKGERDGALRELATLRAHFAAQAATIASGDDAPVVSLE